MDGIESLSASSSTNPFCFKLTFQNKSILLGAESQGAMEGWMKSLACASYDYIKIMADDLQQQLDELCRSKCFVIISVN